MAERKRSRVLLTLAIALAAIAVLGYLFIHSLATTRSEPYTVERAQLARTGGAAFDAAALTPVMFVGASDPVFHRWLPIRAGDADCVAPIQVDPS